MTRTDPGELFQGFLQAQAEAHAEGLGTPTIDGLVTPFEDTPFRPLDARAAWTDAVAVVGLFPGVGQSTIGAVPPTWPGLLLALEPTADVPLALGHFPQRVRSLTLLLRRVPTPTTTIGDRSDLLTWARSQAGPLPRLLAAGVLRLTGELDACADLLNVDVPASLESLRANESAALTWQRGDHRAALAAWQTQPAGPAVLFNRGLACLFLGEKGPARTALDAACAALPESGAWHHLASIYRTLIDLG